ATPYKREPRRADPVQLRRRLTEPNWERMFAIFAALRQGWTVAEIAEATAIDPWLLREIRELVELERERACCARDTVPGTLLRRAKGWGTTDERLAGLLHCTIDDVVERRK